jgi:hypothetical protein
VPPGPKEKERKGRYVAAGSALVVRKGVNPVTEALDALDCAWGALPKGLRWQIQREDFRRQAREARAKGEKLRKRAPQMKTPRDENGNRLRDADGKLVPAPRAPEGFRGSIPLDAIGLSGQSLSVPTANPGGVAKQNQYLGAREGQFYQPLTPQAKAAAVYRHADKLDLDEFAKCMAVNEVEDRALGWQSKRFDKVAQEMRRVHGLETGGLF